MTPQQFVDREVKDLQQDGVTLCYDDYECDLGEPFTPTWVKEIKELFLVHHYKVITAPIHDRFPTSNIQLRFTYLLAAEQEPVHKIRMIEQALRRPTPIAWVDQVIKSHGLGALVYEDGMRELNFTGEVDDFSPGRVEAIAREFTARSFWVTMDPLSESHRMRMVIRRQ